MYLLYNSYTLSHAQVRTNWSQNVGIGTTAATVRHRRCVIIWRWVGEVVIEPMTTTTLMMMIFDYPGKRFKGVCFISYI